MDSNSWHYFGGKPFVIWAYVDGEYVEAVWDAKRRAWVFPSKA